ncbi:MAG: carboxypeptidase regulatory-like domain-containing protein [Bryobacteraceae bacterium]
MRNRNAQRLLCATLLAASTWAQTPAGTEPDRYSDISGTVTDEVSRAPVENAFVTLSALDASRRFAIRSGPDGRYAFHRIQPGTYYIEVEADGYLRRTYGVTSNARQPLTLIPGADLTGIDIKLMPTGAVSGRVLDEAGRPVVGAQVQLLRARNAGGKNEWQSAFARCTGTDDRGEYRCFDVEPGRYALCAGYPHSRNERLMLASPGRKLAYLEMYYPGVLSIAEALPIVVGPGQEQPGIDVKLTRVPVSRIRGRVRIESATANDPMSITVFARRVDGPNSFGFRVAQARPEFEFALLPPGVYRLTVTHENREASVRIELRDSDLDDVELVLRGGGPVRGRIIARPEVGCGRFGTHAVFPSIERVDESSRSHLLTTRPDGVFELKDAPPGEYVVKLLDFQSHCYLRSLQLSGVPLPGNIVTIPPGGLSGLELVPGAAGTVAGTVRDREGKPVPGALVLCVQRDRQTAEPIAACSANAADQSGAFEMRYLIPGEVRLIALREYDRDAPLPASAYSQSTAVTVRENATETTELQLLAP